MAQLQRPKTKNIVVGLCALGALLAACLTVVYLNNDNGFVITHSEQTEASTTPASHEVTTTTITAVLIHIDGAVVNPGVYELKDGDRIQQAVEAAGGLAEGASTITINLASKLVDGQKIHIPTAEELEASSASQSASDSSSEGATNTSLVNINTATADELDTLPGVGPSTAALIIADREQSGAFSSIEDLMRISGIGEKKFAKIKDYICV